LLIETSPEAPILNLPLEPAPPLLGADEELDVAAPLSLVPGSEPANATETTWAPDDASISKSPVLVIRPVDAVESLPMLATDVVSFDSESIALSDNMRGVTAAMLNVPLFCPEPVTVMT
jgi:hypothetical protein